jgi:hypothetical protein
MDAHQERVVQAFRRVGGWFAANPQYVAASPSLAKQLEALDGIVTRVSDHAAAQETQRAQSMLISKDEIEKRREVLSNQMAPIAKLARTLRGTVPGIGVLSRPKGNVSTSELITAATAMIQKAAVYTEVLVENGLPADFAQQLQGAAAALKSSLDGRGLARASRVAATRGVESEVALGQRVVAIIDVVVTRQIRGEPAKLAEWEQLKRVTAKGVAVRGQVGVVETSSTPVLTSSTPVLTSSTHVVAASTPDVKAA